MPKVVQVSTRMIVLSVAKRRAQPASWSSTTNKCTTRRSSTECSCVVITQRTTIVQSMAATKGANQHQPSGGTFRMKPSTASKRCLTKALQYGIIERIPSTWWRIQSIGCLVAATFDTSMQRNERESKSLTTRAAKAMTYSESTSIVMSNYAYLLYLIPLLIKIVRLHLQFSSSSSITYDLYLLILLWSKEQHY